MNHADLSELMEAARFLLYVKKHLADIATWGMVLGCVVLAIHFAMLRSIANRD